MAFTLGQKTYASQVAAAQSQAFSSNVTAGNLLHVCSATFSTGGSISTPIANSGTATLGTWTQLVAPFSSSSAADTTAMWCALVTGTGSCTVTLTWSTAGAGEMCVAEFSGSSISSALVQDGTGQTAQGTAATITTPTITTTVPDALILIYITANTTVTDNSPWVLVANNVGDHVGYLPGATPGTTSPNQSVTSSPFSSIVAAVGIPGAPAGPPRRAFLPIMAPQGGL